MHPYCLDDIKCEKRDAHALFVKVCINPFSFVPNTHPLIGHQPHGDVEHATDTIGSTYTQYKSHEFQENISFSPLPKSQCSTLTKLKFTRKIPWKPNTKDKHFKYGVSQPPLLQSKTFASIISFTLCLKLSFFVWFDPFSQASSAAESFHTLSCSGFHLPLLILVFIRAS